MDDEVILCAYHKCNLHTVRPGKTQCSYEDKPVCGMNEEDFDAYIKNVKDLQDDLNEADFCIDYLQGKVLERDAEIDRLTILVLHLLYCPKQACSFCSEIEKEFRNER
jgi:hypothetical protein